MVKKVWQTDGRTDRQTDGRTDGLNQSYSCLVAAKNVIFHLVLLTGIFKSFHDNVIRWIPHDLTDDKSTLVQVMAWCRQATSHYLSQCWLSSAAGRGRRNTIFLATIYPSSLNLEHYLQTIMTFLMSYSFLWIPYQSTSQDLGFTF